MAKPSLFRTVLNFITGRPAESTSPVFDREHAIEKAANEISKDVNSPLRAVFVACMQEMTALHPHIQISEECITLFQHLAGHIVDGPNKKLKAQAELAETKKSAEQSATSYDSAFFERYSARHALIESQLKHVRQPKGALGIAQSIETRRRISGDLAIEIFRTVAALPPDQLKLAPAAHEPSLS